VPVLSATPTGAQVRREFFTVDVVVGDVKGLSEVLGRASGTHRRGTTEVTEDV
jgi:hypothetical protein